MGVYGLCRNRYTFGIKTGIVSVFALAAATGTAVTATEAAAAAAAEVDLLELVE